jgi:hypothetical protein
MSYSPLSKWVKLKDAYEHGNKAAFDKLYKSLTGMLRRIPDHEYAVDSGWEATTLAKPKHDLIAIYEIDDGISKYECDNEE